MTEQMLINLMGDLDVSLLNNSYMEDDLKHQKKKNTKIKFGQSIFCKGSVFTIHESLQTAVNEQRELIDAVVAHPYEEQPRLVKKLETKMQAVKRKLHTAIAITSGILAMIILAISVVTVIAKKKALSKLMSKSVQTA